MGVIRAVTADELLDLEPWVGQVRMTFRYDVLDQDLVVQGTVNPVLNNPSINADTSGIYRRSLSGVTMTPTDGAALDPFDTRIRPMLVLETGDEYPLGVFAFADVSYRRYSFGRILEANTLVDQGVLIDQERDATFTVTSGSLLRDAALDIISELGMTAIADVDACTLTARGAIAWRAGTSRLTILEDIAKLMLFYPPYFANTGRLKLEGVPLPLLDASADHDFNLRMIDGTIYERIAPIKAPNRYSVVNTVSGTGAVTGIWEVPSTAPHSSFQRGIVVDQHIDDPGIASSADAALRAEAAAAIDYQSYEWLEFDSPLDPRVDLFDLYDYDGDLYREVGFTQSLSAAGPMHHSLRKVY